MKAISVSRRCECNGKLYKNIKAHHKSQKHQMFLLKREIRELRIRNKRQENEIFALRKALVVSLSDVKGCIEKQENKGVTM